MEVTHNPGINLVLFLSVATYLVTGGGPFFVPYFCIKHQSSQGVGLAKSFQLVFYLHLRVLMKTITIHLKLSQLGINMSLYPVGVVHPSFHRLLRKLSIFPTLSLFLKPLFYPIPSMAASFPGFSSGHGWLSFNPRLRFLEKLYLVRR